MDKLKRPQPSGLFQYLNPTLPFEFIAEYPLEKCVERLSKQTTTHSFRNVNYPQIHVDLLPIDGNLYQFSIRKEQYREANVTATGYMERLEAPSNRASCTLIRGKVEQHEHPFLYAPFVLALSCFFWPIAPFVFAYYILRRGNNNLKVLDLIKSTLGVSEE